MNKQYDKIIIGAGLYGLYAASYCGKKGQRVLVLEYDDGPFQRATYINQARVHMGYHYPRSLTTAVKSACYFRRFAEDYEFCIHDKFEQIYATSAQFSWTDAGQFQEFCRAAGIRCKEVAPTRYFKEGMCDGAFLTEECTYDAALLRDFLQEQLKAMDKVEILCGARMVRMVKGDGEFILELEEGSRYRAPFVLNATYASVNQILNKVEGLRTDSFPIKYELCEIILCEPSEALKPVGFTVMDGPFFSIMPFGKTGLHSLTSVTFTPHITSYEESPRFSCQERPGKEACSCSPGSLGNCNLCPARPKSAWAYMSHLADKYLKEEYGYAYRESLFSMKPILKSSEVDDSRPTAIRVACQNPTLVSVLSGKINTVYDLDEYLT